MSLFPAYSEIKVGNVAAPEASTAPPAADNAEGQWLENSSFALPEVQLKEAQSQSAAPELSTDSSDTSAASLKSDQASVRRKKKKKKHSKSKRSTEEKPQIVLEFSNEAYYVDKKPARQYKTIRTLHKPACPRYRKHFQRRLGWAAAHMLGTGGLTAKSIKRYYRQEKGSMSKPPSEALDENEYTLQLGQLNRKTMEAPAELQPWLDVIQLQQRNPYRWSRLLLAERKLDLIQRALVYHPRCDQLYRLYIDTVNATYPSFEISKMLDRLLAKDPYNYTLWTAQIMTTQGSMARCVVPDVLHIYERCMQKMHHAQKSITTLAAEGSSDEVMLKLFNNCALFLRQAGLYEQFFALVKLALELNVSTDQFGNFAPLDSDQRTLIEYEELILQSGLPMNEIWLRIEKLRQGYNFLPCPAMSNCSDPQRIVFNEDVCHYIYPLKSRDNSFYLMLLILRLLKVPFVQCDCLAEKFCARVEDIGDSDAIEDVLAACLRRTYALPQQQHDEFIECFYELAKEMTVSPTFLNNTIGHELYTRCLTEFILNCAAAYASSDERKRIVFVTLWCRLERVLLILQKCSKKLTPDYVKAGRSRFKALLKQQLNRNVLNFYTEFAIYEYEALEGTDISKLDTIRSLFENIISANAADQTQSSDLCHIYVVYAEILIGRGLWAEALQVLAAYALSVDIRLKGSISAASKLSALQQITEKLESVLTVERNVEIMVLEQYLLPDNTVSLIKQRVLLQCLLGQRLDAIMYMDKLLKTFLHRDSDRHNFLREHIQELYTVVLQLQLPVQNCVLSNALISKTVFAALEEFPRNLFLLQHCGMLAAAPWYKIRAAMLRNNPTILSVIYLIASARYRFIQCRGTASGSVSEAVVAWDLKHTELIVRNRILNLFKVLTPDAEPQNQQQQHRKYNAMQRNALFWRFYLRCLSDQSTAFETSNKCLLTALDECPWSKALYLDGATYVPQELSHLQDLIIEKQLRIYALPEELEILREK